MLKVSNELEKEMIDSYNRIYKANTKDLEEILDILSEEFANNYKLLGDGQDAYNLLEDENREFMSEFAFVYTLFGGKSWDISLSDDFKEEETQNYIDTIKKHYRADINTLEEAIDLINIDISKTISNAGCDVFSALNLILEDIFNGLNVFKITNRYIEPRIDIL